MAKLSAACEYVGKQGIRNEKRRKRGGEWHSQRYTNENNKKIPTDLESFISDF